MYVRNCPKCNSKMLATSMKRGWGKEYKYVCTHCGYSKWIYEGNPNAGNSYEKSNKVFWILLIIVELVLFFSSDFITPLGYAIYISLFILFLYKLLTPNKLEEGHQIIEWIDLITPEEAEEELSLNYAMKDNKILYLIAIMIASVLSANYFHNWYLLLIVFVVYLVMYYYGFLDISESRRKKFFTDKEFENKIDKITVKVDIEGKPILPND